MLDSQLLPKGEPTMKAFFFLAIAACVLAGFGSRVAAQSNADKDFVAAQITATPHLNIPAEALVNGLGGNVRVKVLIDEAGNVTSADDVVGPGYVCRQIERTDVVAMRNAAKQAALLAKFTPATEKGVPVASSIWLNFNFSGAEALNIRSYTAKKAEPKTDSEKFMVIGTKPDGAPVPPPTGGGPMKSDGGPTLPPGATGAAKSDGTTPRIPKQIQGGVLNGKATSLVKPKFPPAARAVRAEGGVEVQVLIDEDGNIFAAQAISGHPLLRSAAVGAACESKFSPTHLSGYPVKVLGIITYNFVP